MISNEDDNKDFSSVLNLCNNLVVKAGAKPKEN